MEQEEMDKKNQHIDHIGLIIKVLAGEATTEEKTELESLIIAEPEIANLYDEYTRLWNTLGAIKDMPDIDIDKEWDTFLNKTSQADTGKIIPINKPKSIFRNILQYAAILLIGIITASGIYYFVRQAQYEKYSSDNTIENIELPDGSQVTLNLNSSIKFHKNLTKNNTRNVILKGDAYFDVESDKSNPFIIDIMDIKVEVKGTSFYIDTHKGQINIIVKSGTVMVYSPDNKSEKNVLLTKGDKGIYSLKNTTF